MGFMNLTDRSVAILGLQRLLLQTRALKEEAALLTVQVATEKIPISKVEGEVKEVFVTQKQKIEANIKRIEDPATSEKKRKDLVKACSLRLKYLKDTYYSSIPGMSDEEESDEEEDAK